MRGWVTSIGPRGLGLRLLFLGLCAAAPPPGSLAVTVTGLRSAQGLVRACLTADPTHFPACDKDPAARRLTVAARDAGVLRFDDLAPGGYALALFHDENGNGRLDTRMGVPIEGFGFSNNPRIWFGPPRFTAARVAVGDAPVSTVVRLRYLF